MSALTENVDRVGGGAMRESTRKWGRRLVRFVFVLVVGYWAVKTADLVWFRAFVPITFQHANWVGAWRTNQYGLSGRLLVRLPDPLPDNKEFKAEALVYYPIYSGWKTGQFVKMSFTGYFSPNASSSSGKSTVPSNVPVPNIGGELKFKGFAGDQIVDYVALIDSDRSLIVGGYLSQAPYDYGSFGISSY
jgi:hypothetical protein